MAFIRPFKGIRPPKELVFKLASLPYDVLNSEEAKKLSLGNQYSFLRVTKPEIELDPKLDLYSPQVYEKAKDNFELFKRQRYLLPDPEKSFYIYKQVMDGRSQIGLVACCEANEYWDDTIKKHELTRIDKEDDRLKHLESINANAGPVFLTYRANEKINDLIGCEILKNPDFDFTTEDGIQHILWVVTEAKWLEKIANEFSKIPNLYVADGHHRSAAAARFARKKKESNPNHSGEEEYNFFLAVLFPHNHLLIMDYNRAIKDLNGLSEETFIREIGEKFFVEKTREKKPSVKNEFGMYLNGQWYKLRSKPGSFDSNDCILSLDVSILQTNILFPILGIIDPRKDKRIDFIGGIRGTAELERLVN
ncbi:DUF1015 domain-containing protein, partial [bacterium]|nr:DUF1015 domain-containing protein [bacterium]